ncbi:MAG TPA: phosphonopyruvate decarboxylase [Planctomycetota bacterium]|nr:phosphonopyruvate decarboxylase [Planctomycetota bacterium]
MLTCQQMHNILKEHKLDFFAGVPDSVFKEWLKYLDNCSDFTHIAASNECDAIALATGYHLSSGNIGVAYMQNSGLCNALNPLTSLTDKEVYSIPMILLIGWRGKPGEHDEPQHIKMGRITIPILETLEIAYSIPEGNEDSMKQAWDTACIYTKEHEAPYAIVLQKGMFEKFDAPKQETTYSLTREQALEKILQHTPPQYAFVSTTGFLSRELYEYRDRNNQSHATDFYTVGSMGCSLSIAAGIALGNPKQQVLALDADGAALMHLGSWAPLGNGNYTNLRHILFDNACYESTGAQPTQSSHINFCQIALAIGYKKATQVENMEQLQCALTQFFQQGGPCLLVVKIKQGYRKDLGRPKTKPKENKKFFMNFLQQSV